MVKLLKVITRDCAGRAARVELAKDDGIKVGDVRITPDGYMIAENVRVARTGVQEYSALELGLDASMKTIRLYRPPESVFAAASMASLDRKPTTYYHPEHGVDSSNWRQNAVGHVEGPKQDGDFLVVEKFIVNDRSAVEAVAFGVKEVSCGYSFRLEMKAGTTPSGEAYDGLQLDIEHNHVAIVYAGRCGGGCAIGDCACQALTAPNPKTEDATMKIKIGKFEIPVADENTGAIITGELAARDEALTAVTKRATDAEAALTAQSEAMKKLAADHAAEKAALEAKVLKPEQVQALVAETAAVIGDAKRVAPEFVTDGKTAAQIRAGVLDGVIAGKDDKLKALASKLLGGVEPAKASDVRLTAAFDTVVAVAGDAAGGTGSEYETRVKDALSGGGSGAAADGARTIKYRSDVGTSKSAA
jgi:hypothetical protein